MRSQRLFRRLSIFLALTFLLGNACKNSTKEDTSENELAAHSKAKGSKEKREKEKGESKKEKGGSEKGEAKREGSEKKESSGQETQSSSQKASSGHPSTRSMDPGHRSAPLPGTKAFRQHFGKKGQRFTLDPERDTTIRCNEGTILHFPSHAFAKSDGEKVKEKVAVTVEEYYDNADILMAGLGTKSNGRILETGGMVRVEAQANGKECELRDGKAMQIEFPRKKEQQDMKLFCGDRKEDGRMNWKVESGADLNASYSKDELDQKPMFPGGDSAQTLYIMEHTEYPPLAKRRGKEGIVRIGVRIDRSGDLRDPRLLDRAAPSLNRAAFSMVKGMPPWIPAQKDGQRVKSRDTVKVKFQLSDAMKEEKAEEPMSAEEFEKKMEGDGKIAEASAGEISNYLFRSTQMGWLNCDRFIDRLSSKEYVVELEEKPAKSDVKLFLHEQKSFLKADLREGEHVFEQVPRNAEISLVVIQASQKGYQMAVEGTNTRNEDPELSFEQVTMERLKAEMKRLNDI